MSKLKLSQQGLVLIAVPLLFEMVFVATLAVLLKQAEQDVSREAHSRTVVSESNNLMQHFFDAGSAIYAYKLTKSPMFATHYDEIAQQIPDEIRSLKRILIDNPHQEEAIQRVEAIGNKGIESLSAAKRIIDGTGTANDISRLQSAGDVKQIVSQLIDELHKFVDEQKKSEQLDPAQAAHSRLAVVYWLAGGVALNILLAIFLAVYFNRGTAKRLQVLMNNTRQLAQNKELLAPLSGNDELAHLDHVFHSMADELAAAAQAKKEMVAMVSHDLRTPLTSVQGSLTLLSAGVYGGLSDRAMKEVTIAENNTSRLINLINDLLDVERMEAGRLEMTIRQTFVSQILEQTSASLESFAKQNNIELDLPETGLSLNADGERLVQVLINLVSNAIKFSPPNSTVTVTVEKLSDCVEFRVIDQGRGIPPEFIDSVFERFQQVKKSDAGRKGTGLGLAICKAIIDGHGGTIGVTSRVGKGSTFWFRIPS